MKLNGRGHHIYVDRPLFDGHPKLDALVPRSDQRPLKYSFLSFCPERGFEIHPCIIVSLPTCDPPSKERAVFCTRVNIERRKHPTYGIRTPG